jgi:hypothetical protein
MRELMYDYSSTGAERENAGEAKKWNPRIREGERRTALHEVMMDE